MKVQRRPPKPWTVFGVARKGAPRTLLSADTQPVYVSRAGSGRINTGTIDYGLRLYQHSSGKGFKHLLYEAQGMTCVSYGLQNEWPVIKICASWIECIDFEHNVVYRCSVSAAKKNGFRWETKLGPRYLVPLMEYERVTR